jgi:serine phosphatase RsbU (regulator of sigma subunit)/anti-sigma regulatory factor (Ser/Thr protein kinase)
MENILQSIQRRWIGRSKSKAQVKLEQAPNAAHKTQLEIPAFDIAPHDPIMAYFLSIPEAVEVDKLNLDSPALRALQAGGVKMAVPLVSQGELVGLLMLGPRRTEQEYTTDDRVLLNTLAVQAAPAVRVAQMVREQQAVVRERERLEQELRVARLIQQTLLPKNLPTFPGWKLAAHYQSAHAVGGDFYDFLLFENGRLGIIIGDVSDKGVPAAMVMTSTRSILRSAAHGATSPGKVLELANDLLCPDILPKMFVTCLYAILDPASGHLQYANAGHDLPYRLNKSGVSKLHATGVPLGLMPGMQYEEKETIIAPGERILFYSDGLVEAHNAERDMFGFPRLTAQLEEYIDNIPLIDFLLRELAMFTGTYWEQEDDVTLVTLQRLEDRRSSSLAVVSVSGLDGTTKEASASAWQILGEWTLASEPGNERLAMEEVAKVVQPLGLSTRRLEQLKTAVAEATMNAIEHGNSYRPDRPVFVQARVSGNVLSVCIEDRGGTRQLPEEPPVPDIEAKLAELQTPRGWGLFLIKNMVDEMHVTNEINQHTVELILYLEE